MKKNTNFFLNSRKTQLNMLIYYLQIKKHGGIIVGMTIIMNVFVAGYSKYLILV